MTLEDNMLIISNLVLQNIMAVQEKFKTYPEGHLTSKLSCNFNWVSAFKNHNICAKCFLFL